MLQTWFNKKTQISPISCAKYLMNVVRAAQMFHPYLQKF